MPRVVRYGIPIDSFWKLTPRIFNIYKKEYEKEEQKKMDEIDYIAWIHGLYVRTAIVSSINSDVKYPEECFSSKGEYEESTEIAAIRFGEWAEAFNNQNKR